MPPSPIFSRSLYRPMTVPGPSVRRQTGHDPSHRLECGRIEKLAGLLVGLEQERFDLAPQLGILAAGLVQIGRSLCPRVFSRSASRKIALLLVSGCRPVEFMTIAPAHSTMRNLTRKIDRENGDSCKKFVAGPVRKRCRLQITLPW